eukprot:scaffold151806_cov26-Tisochrysis_lutea.AAC.1
MQTFDPRRIVLVQAASRLSPQQIIAGLNGAPEHRGAHELRDPLERRCSHGARSRWQLQPDLGQRAVATELVHLDSALKQIVGKRIE